jgi:hypothetical protein
MNSDPAIEQLKADQVFAVIEALAEAGSSEFRPGDIADTLRAQGTPLLTWEIRGELSRLEAAGQITVDTATGAYSVVPDAARKTG